MQASPLCAFKGCLLLFRSDARLKWHDACHFKAIYPTCSDIGVLSIGYGRINAAQAVGSVPVPPGGITGQEYRKVCSSAELLRHVWGPEYGDEKDILKLNVHRLRSEIEEYLSSPEIILSERGVGYVIRASSSSE